MVNTGMTTVAAESKTVQPEGGRVVEHGRLFLQHVLRDFNEGDDCRGTRRERDAVHAGSELLSFRSRAWFINARTARTASGG